MFKRTLTAASLLVCALAFSSYAAELKDFPAQTRWVLTMDVKAVQNSPLLNDLVGQMDTNEVRKAKGKLAAVKAMFGVDLLKDIDHLVIAGNGDTEKGGVAYVYGNFDAQRLTTILAGAKDYASADHSGVAVQSWLDEKDNKRKHMVFFSPGLALLSNAQNVLTDALDVLSGKTPGLAAESPLSGAFVRNGQNLLTLHACGLSSIVGAVPKAEALKQAEALSLHVSTSGAESVDVTLSVTATSEATAQQIQQALLGIQAIALLRAAEAPEPAAFASQAKITCQNRTVGLTMALSKSLMESALRAREAFESAKKDAAAAPAPADTK